MFYSNFFAFAFYSRFSTINCNKLNVLLILYDTCIRSLCWRNTFFSSMLLHHCSCCLLSLRLMLFFHSQYPNVIEVCWTRAMRCSYWHLQRHKKHSHTHNICMWLQFKLNFVLCFFMSENARNAFFLILSPLIRFRCILLKVKVFIWNIIELRHFAMYFSVQLILRTRIGSTLSWNLNKILHSTMYPINFVTNLHMNANTISFGGFINWTFPFFQTKVCNVWTLTYCRMRAMFEYFLNYFLDPKTIHWILLGISHRKLWIVHAQNFNIIILNGLSRGFPCVMCVCVWFKVGQPLLKHVNGNLFSKR